MGLLDEAIREHLELKRRRGADPSAVAREEREALAPVYPDASATPDVEADGAPAKDTSGDVGPGLTEPAPTPPSPQDDGLPAGSPALAEETAELDMLAVIEQNPDASAEHTERVTSDSPGQERLSFE
jgi:hypothetical protein